MTKISDIIKPANVAVITGGASGIGLAAAKRFTEAGMCVALADRNADRLGEARAELEAISGEANVMAVETDVAHRHELEALQRAVLQRFGRVHVLMNNAGIQPDTSIFSTEANWDHILSVNLMGVIHGTQVFGPDMLAHGEPGLIINTGSKQGITTPPGNPAYNVTEALEHELRNTEGAKVSAHLLIPGFVFTALTKGERTEKPDAAWTPAQTVEFMMESLERGDFYILCPDNDVPRALDERRMAWAMGDVIGNRPPLSRWHKDYAEKFRAFVEEG